MKRKAAALGIGLMLLLPTAGRAADLDFHLSYGRWTFSPFTSLVERETENLIKNELVRFVDTFLPRDAFSTLQTIDMSSSGQIVSFTLWYNINRFSLGLETGLFEFNLPYTISAEQSIQFLNNELLGVYTEGSGEVRLSSVTFSLLTRWAVLSSPRFKLYLRAGMNLLPYAGEVSLDQRTVVETPLGDAEYTGRFSETIKNIRDWDEDIPTLLVSPTFGVNFQYNPMPRLGIFIGLSIHEGTFISAGICFSL